MKWAIQATLLESWKTDEWADTALANGQDVSGVFLRPFEDNIDDAVDFDLNDTQSIIFFGSVKLIRLIAQDDRTFAPGVFFNDKFDYQVSIAENGPFMLNDDADVMSLDDITYEYVQERGPTFVRPVLDLKSFTGGVVEQSTFYKWQDANVMGGAYPYSGIEVIASSPKEIYNEYRCFVVGDHPAQIRRYRNRHQSLCSEAVEPMTEAKIREYLTYAVPPHEVCVIDVAETDKGMFLIEFNCFNGSGTYGHDVDTIVKQLIEYANDHNL